MYSWPQRNRICSCPFACLSVYMSVFLFPLSFGRSFSMFLDVLFMAFFSSRKFCASMFRLICAVHIVRRVHVVFFSSRSASSFILCWQTAALRFYGQWKLYRRLMRFLNEVIFAMQMNNTVHCCLSMMYIICIHFFTANFASFQNHICLR